MTVLSTEQRKEIWAEEMQEMSRIRESYALTKPQGQLAVDALDDSFAAFLVPLNRRGFAETQALRILSRLIDKRKVS